MSDLLLDVSQMREARAHVERTVSADALADNADVYRIDGPVRLAFEIHKDHQHFRLVGRVSATLGLECGRCLVGFALPVDEAFNVLYVPHTEAKAGGEMEIADDDLTTAYYRDHVIDLGQLVIEQFFMVVPMKPLCGEACQGLCPLCGINLNTGSCSCTEQWVDPRLAVLREIKKETKDT